MDVPSFLGPCLITSETDEFSVMDPSFNVTATVAVEVEEAGET